METGERMSDFDLGDHDGGFGDVHAQHEDLNLDQDHQAFDNNADHLHNFDANADNHASELDEHFANAHHVEADDPRSHFEQDDFTNADVHASDTDQHFDVNSNEADHVSNVADIDALRESLEHDALDVHEVEPSTVSH
jgi:hypothetical protein